MTKIRDYHKRVDADRQAKKAELDPSRVPGLPAAAPVAPKAKKGKKK
jgi:hypothetical protein